PSHQNHWSDCLRIGLIRPFSSHPEASHKVEALSILLDNLDGLSATVLNVCIYRGRQKPTRRGYCRDMIITPNRRCCIHHYKINNGRKEVILGNRFFTTARIPIPSIQDPL